MNLLLATLRKYSNLALFIGAKANCTDERIREARKSGEILDIGDLTTCPVHHLQG